MEDDFADDSVLVVMKNAISLEFNEYDESDFDEIEVDAVEEMTVNLTKKIHSEFNSKKLELKESLNKTENAGILNISSVLYNGAISDKKLTTVADNLAKEEIERQHSTFHQILEIKLKNKSKQVVLDTVQKLEERNDIIVAEPNYITKTAAVPNDANYSKQWAIDNINLTSAWDITTGSMSSINCISGEDIKISYNGFSKAGYYFVGWNIVDDCGYWSTSDGQWETEPNKGAYIRYYTSIDYVNYLSDDGDNLTAYAQWSSKYLIKGDANLDGVVNSEDVTLIQNYLSSIVTLTNLQMYFADYNKDGKVNINDATAIQRYLS